MIIVMSDSHGESKVIQDIKATYQDEASAIIHCGDSELDATDPIWEGIRVVRGNCDFDTLFPESLVLSADQAQVFVTHGHLYGVNFGLSQLTDAAKKAGCKLALFGHLHTPIATIEQDILCLNPGSVAQPRGQYKTKMYAKIDITADAYVISYMDLAHQPIANLQFRLARSSQ
ncbi:metallophosphoesterase [Pseudolactococcus piscium]|nr:metallophosphoesterase [Lactococcus piscium]